MRGATSPGAPTTQSDGAPLTGGSSQKKTLVYRSCTTSPSSHPPMYPLSPWAPEWSPGSAVSIVDVTASAPVGAGASTHAAMVRPRTTAASTAPLVLVICMACSGCVGVLDSR